MRPSTTYARIALFVMGVNALGMATASAADPSWPSWTLVLLDGQLALLVVWTALGPAPWYFRWPCVGVLPYLISQPWSVAEDGTGLWRDAVVLSIVPHALTALALLCLLRELGARIVAEGVPLSQIGTLRRFTLRRMFAWTAGVAALLVAWKRVVELQHGVPWFDTLSPWQFLIFNAGVTVPDVMLDWMAIAVTLNRSKLTSRLMWLSLLALVAPAQSAASGFFVQIVSGSVQPWWRGLWTACEYDLLYVAPVVTVLLLARAAGYRLTWSSGREE
jgi:hypothetical protein